MDEKMTGRDDATHGCLLHALQSGPFGFLDCRVAGGKDFGRWLLHPARQRTGVVFSTPYPFGGARVGSVRDAPGAA
jgi:hypothetical protein